MSGIIWLLDCPLDCPSPIPPYCRIIIIAFIPVHESAKETSNLFERSRPTTDITVNFHAVLSKIPPPPFFFCSVFLSINHFGLFALSFAQVWSYLLALLVCGHLLYSLESHIHVARIRTFITIDVKENESTTRLPAWPCGSLSTSRPVLRDTTN